MKSTGYNKLKSLTKGHCQVCLTLFVVWSSIHLIFPAYPLMTTSIDENVCHHPDLSENVSEEFSFTFQTRTTPYQQILDLIKDWTFKLEDLRGGFDKLPFEFLMYCVSFVLLFMMQMKKKISDVQLYLMIISNIFFGAEMYFLLASADLISKQNYSQLREILWIVLAGFVTLLNFYPEKDADADLLQEIVKNQQEMTRLLKQKKTYTISGLPIGSKGSEADDDDSNLSEVFTNDISEYDDTKVSKIDLVLQNLGKSLKKQKLEIKVQEWLEDMDPDNAEEVITLPPVTNLSTTGYFSSDDDL